MLDLYQRYPVRVAPLTISRERSICREVFCKNCSRKFSEIHRKIPEGLQVHQKETPAQELSFKFCKTFWKIFFQ